MKTQLADKLRNSVSYFLSFCNADVPFPEIEVRDGADESVQGIALEFAVTDQLQISDVCLVANANFSKSEEEHEAGVCHEIGHLIDLIQDPREPSDSFRSILKNELRADRYGLRLYMLAGREKKGFYSIFRGNFPELFKRLQSDRNIEPFAKHAKCIIINVIRMLVCLFQDGQEKE